MSGIPLFLWVDEKKWHSFFYLVCCGIFWLAGDMNNLSKDRPALGVHGCALLLLSACQVGRCQVCARPASALSCALCQRLKVLIVSSWFLFLSEMRSSVLQWSPGQCVSVSWEDFGIHACSLLLPFFVFPLEPLPSAQLTSRDLEAVEPMPCFSFPLPVCAQRSLPPFPLHFPRALPPVQPDSINLTCFSCTSFLPG